MREYDSHPFKHLRVAAEIRRRILSGKYKPGRMLESRDELIREFEVSRATIQQAFNLLIHEGVITARRKSGTHVAADPLLLRHYGLVFPHRPEEKKWSQFWTILRDEALHRSPGTLPRLSVFYGGHGQAGHPDYEHLAEEVSSYRVAGLIFPAHPLELQGKLPLTQEGISRIHLTTGAQDRFSGEVVHLNWPALVEKAMDSFVAKNRKRVAVLILPGDGPSNFYIDYVRLCMKKRGITSPSHWVQGVHPSCPGWSGEVVKLLLSLEKKERPDALFISDDTLVPGALAGIAGTGLNIPRDIDVVAHTNFPAPPSPPLPVRRLGYDIRYAFKLCLDLIQSRQSGHRTIPFPEVPAVFEDELTQDPSCLVAQRRQNHEFSRLTPSRLS